MSSPDQIWSEESPTKAMRTSAICKGIKVQDCLQEQWVPWAVGDTNWKESHWSQG